MEIRLYFQMLQRGWWIILLVALVALTASLAISYMAIPQYQATARFIISPKQTITSEKDVVDSLSTLDKRSIAATYAEVMNSNRAFADTVAALQLNALALQDYTYETVVLPDSSVLELNVSGPNPTVAAELANTLGYTAIALIERLNQVYDVNFLDTATPPDLPYSPQPLRDGSLALLLGAIVGAVLAILREQIRTPIDSLRRRTMVDQDSSAYNRRYFQRQLEQAQARSATGNIALGLIHLDGLGDMIDRLPPVLSQQLLHEVTRELRNELRGNDIVGRWSDIEFAVMLPATPTVAAERTLDRIREELTKPIYISQTNDSVSLDPFVAVSVSQPQEEVSSLISRAEDALAQSRREHLAKIGNGAL